MMRYKAEKTVQITGANKKGDALGPISFSKGFYETEDEDEIALLDALATDPDHPVGFDPKNKEA
ncbi:MAG: hypothetical protein ACRDIC_06140 [bacterium]